MDSQRHRGWLALAAVASLMAALAVINAIYDVFTGEPLGVLWLLVAIPFWYLIGVGAWRRAEGRSSARSC